MDLLANNDRTLGRRYALCVGIGTYTCLSNRNLRYAVADAMTIAERLADPQRGDFAVRVLKEPIETTKAALDEAVKYLLSAPDRQAEDFILLYFSCHGDVNKTDNTFCLLPSNATLKAKEEFEQTTVIGISDLASWFSISKTRNIVLLLDVCHSGGAGIALQHFTLHLDTDLNIFIIGAARQDRTTTENSSLEHGMFTHCLLRAFEQPPTKDGWLTISQIQNFVGDEISWFAKDQPMQIQVSSVSVNQHLPLVRNPGYPELCPLPPLWNVPLPRNPFFTEQGDVVSQLARMLQREQKTALTQPYSLNGLGGIGKTQLALEYAYRHRQDYHAILWGRADTREALISTFVNIAHLLKLPEKDENDQMIIVQAVKSWLMNRTQWLFILDNADELTLVKEFIPPAFGGHLLLTTRVQAMGGVASNFEVEAMQPEIGALLLLHRSGLIAQDASLEAATTPDGALAKELSRTLGGLPLALDQAGAYLQQTGYGLADYQKIYQDHRKRLLEARGGVTAERPDPAEHPDSVAATWSVSFDRVAQKNVLATQLLHLCAFLSADAIPLEVMTDGPNPLEEDLLILGEAIEILRVYSLVKHDPATRTLSIHRLVQAVIQDAMAPSERALWHERVIQALDDVFPEATVTVWPRCERLLSHVLVAANFSSDENESLELGRCLRKAGTYLSGHAQYGEAESLLQRARQITEQQLEPDPSELTLLFNGLAMLSFRQGKYAQAEPLLQQALQIMEGQLSSDHFLEGITLSNLGLVYFQQGKYAQAEPLLQQALQIMEGQLGSDHFLEPLWLNNLGLVYFQQGKYAQAEPLLQRAVQALDHLEDFVHHDFVLALGNLGLMYAQQHKYAEAVSVSERALQISEQQLGSDHPSVALLLANLAQFYILQDKYTEAEPLLQRAVQICEQRSDVEHTYVIAPLLTLANLYYQQDKYTEAEPLLQQALQTGEQQLGSDHLDVAAILCKLGNVYREQGKYLEAESLIQRALQIKEQLFGLEHSHVADTLIDLADLYKAQQKYVQAESLLQRALQIREQKLGLDHLDVATTLNNLGNLYYRQNNYARAEPLYQRALQISEQHSGPDDLQVASSLERLANLYYWQDKNKKAEPLYQRALQIREQHLGPDHLDLAYSLNGLAKIYCEQFKRSKAASLYERVLEIRQKHLDPDHLDIAYALRKLAHVYRDQGALMAAELLCLRALQIREQKLGHEHPETREVRKDYVLLKWFEVAVYCFLFLLFSICLITWFFHKFDVLSWIALALAVLSGLRLAIGGYSEYRLRRDIKQQTTDS